MKGKIPMRKGHMAVIVVDDTIVAIIGGHLFLFIDSIKAFDKVICLSGLLTQVFQGWGKCWQSEWCLAWDELDTIFVTTLDIWSLEDINAP